MEGRLLSSVEIEDLLDGHLEEGLSCGQPKWLFVAAMESKTLFDEV
jgi:hypothetical protein